MISLTNYDYSEIAVRSLQLTHTYVYIYIHTNNPPRNATSGNIRPYVGGWSPSWLLVLTVIAIVPSSQLIDYICMCIYIYIPMILDLYPQLCWLNPIVFAIISHQQFHQISMFYPAFLVISQ